MHENVPVRFGRGRLDSLATKGLAAYLIAKRKERRLARPHNSSSKPSVRADPKPVEMDVR